MSNKTRNTSGTNNTVKAADFGWYYGKNGDIKTIVSKPFTIDELKRKSKVN